MSSDLILLAMLGGLLLGIRRMLRGHSIWLREVQRDQEKAEREYLAAERRRPRRHRYNQYGEVLDTDEEGWR